MKSKKGCHQKHFHQEVIDDLLLGGVPPILGRVNMLCTVYTVSICDDGLGLSGSVSFFYGMQRDWNICFRRNLKKYHSNLYACFTIFVNLKSSLLPVLFCKSNSLRFPSSQMFLQLLPF